MRSPEVRGSAYTRGGMADRDDLERIRQAVNLVELFEGVTTVRKLRGTFKALCPFHTEKTPSMSIDAARGLYHCFGCGVGGDVFTFVQETQGLEFAEAVEMLADRAGIVVRRAPGAAKRSERRRRLIEAIEAAGRFYHSRLKKAPDAGHARSYVRGRDYGEEVIDRFEIGYAPDSFDALTGHLRDRGFKDRDLLDAGLARRNQAGRLFDLLRGRLMFPIRNVRGEMVGFGGRLLRGDGPKYLNTAETALYKKSELLYGLDRSRSAISREGTAVVVEGYTDVIAFHVAGMPVAVATCGTALGEGHFDLLRRFASRVVLAFDADAAGAGAAVRGDELRITTDLSIELRVAQMPKGRDPADLVQEGKADLLKEAVDGSKAITEFRIDRIMASYDLRELGARSRAMREAARLLASHPDEVDLIQHAIDVAKRTRISEQLVFQEIAEMRKGSGRSPGQDRTTSDARSASNPIDRSERDLLRHMIAGTAPGERIADHLFEDQRALGLAGMLREVGRHLAPGTAVPLSEIEDRRLATLARSLAVLEEPLIPVADVLAHLESRYANRYKDELRRRLDSIDPAKDRKEYIAILGELEKLRTRNELVEE